MADWFSTRVPVHPNDARVYKKRHDDAVDASADIESAMRSHDLLRLKLIAEGKNSAERAMRRSGPVDQEAAARFGVKVADHYGASGRPAGLMAAKGLSDIAVYSTSKPESRNNWHQTVLIPEQVVMHASEALSGDKTLADRAARLLMAVPAAVYPDLGYPVEQAYDRMYDTNPVGAMLMDFAMPGMEVAAGPASRAVSRMRYGAGAPTHLIDASGDVIRRLRNSP
jgi:hypothetical protein